MEAKPKQPTKYYPCISELGDIEDEIKLIGLLGKKPANKIAPLRIKVQIGHDNRASDVLIDSGASKSIINATTMSANIKDGGKLAPSSTTFKTVGSDVTSTGSTMVQFHFPKLNPTTTITPRFEVIIDSKDEMDIGRDLMDSLGIVLNFEDKVVQWEGNQTSLNTGGSGTASVRADTRDREFPDEYKEVVDYGFHPSDLNTDHLPAPLAAWILKLLEEHQLLYDGHLGRMRFDDYVLPLSPDIRAVPSNPYELPRSMEAKTKDEIQRLFDADVLEQIYDSEIVSPAFFITKTNGSLRLLIDFRVLDQYLRRSPYYVPKIREILLRLAGAKFLYTFDAKHGILCQASCQAKSISHGVLSSIRKVPVQTSANGDLNGSR